jgi:hypothetical protein
VVHTPTGNRQLVLGIRQLARHHRQHVADAGGALE